jgi:hypothetical protein
VAERNKRRAVPTLAEFARDRYLPYVQERLRSASNPETHLRLRILPFLGRKALDEINQDDVAALRRKLLAEGLKVSRGDQACQEFIVPRGDLAPEAQ